jgi:hypothetical protein
MPFLTNCSVMLQRVADEKGSEVKTQLVTTEKGVNTGRCQKKIYNGVEVAVNKEAYKYKSLNPLGL